VPGTVFQRQFRKLQTFVFKKKTVKKLQTFVFKKKQVKTALDNKLLVFELTFEGVKHP